MNLNDLDHFETLDSAGMGRAIDGLPDQLSRAWQLGQDLPLPDFGQIDNVVIAGLGGSAIGADLLKSYVAREATVPIEVWRNYDLPAYAAGPRTLVVTSSHSGNTEETLSAFEQSRQAGAQVLAVTTGGRLKAMAQEAKSGLWQFDHKGQPRAAVGFSFGLLLAAFTRLGLIGDPQAEIKDAVDEMKRQQKKLTMTIPVTQNPAKRMAGQIIDRWPTILGADHLAPVARRWRTQIAELAKAVAQFEILPEADHNMLAGVEAPESLFGQTMIIFLVAKDMHPRNVIRSDITREVLMVEGFNTDSVTAEGDTRLAQQWTSLHFGDYVSYYLAMAYGVDPSPVRSIETLKGRLAEFG